MKKGIATLCAIVMAATITGPGCSRIRGGYHNDIYDFSGKINEEQIDFSPADRDLFGYHGNFLTVKKSNGTYITFEDFDGDKKGNPTVDEVALTLPDDQMTKFNSVSQDAKEQEVMRQFQTMYADYLKLILQAKMSYVTGQNK